MPTFYYRENNMLKNNTYFNKCMGTATPKI